MKKLTKVEEEIMQIIWDLNKCLVSDIRNALKEPKAPRSTISSVVRILEKKGFVDHKAYGRTYEYFPVVSKEAYSKMTLKDITQDYFEGSAKELVSFLVKEDELGLKDLDELLELLKKAK